MSAELAQHIATIAPDGLEMTLWPRKGGGYQGNVKERGAAGWTCVNHDDPVQALLGALRSRVTRHPGRQVVAAEPVQLDIEDAVRASTTDCAHGVPMHLRCGACEEENELAELGL